MCNHYPDDEIKYYQNPLSLCGQPLGHYPTSQSQLTSISIDYILPAFEIHVYSIYSDGSFIQLYIWEIDAYLLNAINNPFISMLYCLQCVDV